MLPVFYLSLYVKFYFFLQDMIESYPPEAAGPLLTEEDPMMWEYSAFVNDTGLTILGDATPVSQSLK